MVTKIKKSDFRKLIDECGYNHKIDSDGDFLMILSADKDFGHDVFIWFIVNEDSGTLIAMAEAEDFNISDDNLAIAYIKCNEWNINNTMKGYINNGQFRISYTIFNDEPVSESFIKENFIKLCPSVFWKFYCSLV